MLSENERNSLVRERQARETSPETAKRLSQLLEELTLVEAFVSTRVAALKWEIEALRRDLGLPEGPATGRDPLDLAFRKPVALEAPMIVERYRDVFPGWQIGSGDPNLKFAVQQLPAPESALTYPNYRFIVSLSRKGREDATFLSLEFEAGDRFLADARYCDAAIRVRSEPGLVLNPSLRIFLDTGTWRDFWEAPISVDTEFRSHATTFKIPGDWGAARPIGGRLIYYLPGDTELRLDLAYVVRGFRLG